MMASKNRTKSNPKLHPITFCQECSEPIPARAMACYRCGAKQASGERALQVVFCDRCGRDFPSKAMRCLHCGHQNPRHRFLKGSISR